MNSGFMTMSAHGFVRFAVYLALCVGFIVGSGCEDEEVGPSTSAPKAREKAEKDKEVPAEKRDGGEVSDDARLEYSYNPIGKRDPFRSFIQSTVVQQDLEVETPLQKYEIDQYKLVAIIWGMDEPVAMVEDPEGMGHFLKRDTLIGRNWGKVVRITSTEVVVAEEYRDFEGKLIVNEIPLHLPDDDDNE